MPTAIARLLDSGVFAAFARIVLTFVFWASGLSKLLDFPNGVAEMAAHGLQPAVLFNLLAIVTLLGGSALVILDRWTWLGCGALATFTILTIPIAHGFWNMGGDGALIHFFFATEHVSLIGGLMAMSILSRRHRIARYGATGASFSPAE